MNSFESHLTLNTSKPLNPLSNRAKVFGIFILVVLFLVFFEDFLRMVLPTGSALWLILKDCFLVLLYSIILSQTIVSTRNISFPRISVPLLIYFFILFPLYAYSIVAHESPLSLKLIAARSDLFYIPLVIVIMTAINWPQLPSLLFRLFFYVALINITVASFQFFTPDLLADLPGFSGLREEGLKLHEYRSFGENLIRNVFGIFSGNAKFTRNLLHIFIWLWLLHLIFHVGKFRNLFLLSALIGPILIISGKRLPAILWISFMLSLPVIMVLAQSLSRNKPWSNWRDFISIRKIQYTIVLAITLTVILVAIMYAYSEKLRLYVDLITYAMTQEIQIRFFEGDANYFWQAEVNKIGWKEAIFGQGAGTSSIGVKYIMTDTQYRLGGYLTVEHGPLKVLVEFGLLGILQMLVLWTAIFYVDLRAFLKISFRPRWKAASLLIFIYHLSILASFFVGHSYWGDVQMQIHFWLITGVQLWLGTSATNQQKLQY